MIGRAGSVPDRGFQIRVTLHFNTGAEFDTTIGLKRRCIENAPRQFHTAQQHLDVFRLAEKFWIDHRRSIDFRST